MQAYSKRFWVGLIGGATFGIAFVGLCALALFFDASRTVSKTQPQNTEPALAVLIGTGEVGSFLSGQQQNQLFYLIDAYHKGAINQVYLTAPRSIRESKRIPFAMGEFLVRAGLNPAHIQIDDKATRLDLAFAKIARKLEEHGPSSAIVYADGIDMPEAKVVSQKSGLVNLDYVTTRALSGQDLALGSWTLLADGLLRAGKAYAFETKPLEAVTQSQNKVLETSLVFKPIEHIKDQTVPLAWQSLRFVSNGRSYF